MTATEMRIVIGTDHAGVDLQRSLRKALQEEGHKIIDVGARDHKPVDYPDYAAAVGRMIQRGRADRGVLICGSGVGASIAANKLSGIRAGLCHDAYSARQGVEHDDMNVLVLGARVIGVELARQLLKVFVDAKFSGEERHRRRVEKISHLEQASQPESDKVSVEKTA